jgi:membrane fusion protein (multidrug efflux system)
MDHPDSEEPLFRKEALAHHLAEAEWGALLRVSPAWQRWAYGFVVAAAIIGFAFLLFGSAAVYESGPAVLRVVNVTAIKSPLEATITSVEVVPGQHVDRGQVLLGLGSDQEAVELARVEREFELHLLARLRDPNDVTAEQELRRLRPELDRARADVDRATIRAPREGTVQDVRAQSGDFLRVGDPVLSIVPEAPEFAVVAFLPGQALPQLRTGMLMRLRIAGYAYAYVTTSIDSVGGQVIGPSEARRFLGAELGDTLALNGPVVVVRGKLKGDRFVAWEQEYRLHDGMRASAEIEVRRARLLRRVIPDRVARAVRGD